MPQEAVVIEEQSDGTKVAWNFARREKHKLTCSSGLVGEWLRIDGDDSAPTKPTLTTTCVKVPLLPGKHVMLNVPAVRMPRVCEVQGGAASVGQPQFFWSPFLGPIHAFFDANDIPHDVLLEVDVIKVCDALKDIFEMKYGRRAEWMISKGTINEVNSATEDKPLAVLRTLGIERIEGMVVRHEDENYTIAAELRDGSQKLFVASDSTVEVGDVVSFVPMEVGLDAEVRLAVSCRLSGSGFAKPLGHKASQFLIPVSTFTPFGDDYRAVYLGLVDDSKNVLKGAIRTPKHVIARMDARDGFFRMAVNIQLEQWTLQATCARVKGRHIFFEWFPKELAKYPSFCVWQDRFVDLAGMEPMPGQWYEMVVRFYATPEDFTGDRQTCVLSARCIPKPPTAPDFADQQALSQEPPSLEPKAEWPEAEGHKEQTSSPINVLHSASLNTDGAPCSDNEKREAKLELEEQGTSNQPSTAEITVGKAKVESEEWTLQVTCAYVKGDETFFETIPKEGAKYPLFHVTTKTFVEKTGCSEPVAGQLYMLTLKFYVRSEKATHVPKAYAITALTVDQRQSALQFRRIETTVAASTSKQCLPSAPEFADHQALPASLADSAPSSDNTKLEAKLELEEQVLRACYTYKKGDDAFFAWETTRNRNGERRKFLANLKCFQQCTDDNGPTPGQWYKLTVRFYTRATPLRAHILAAKTLYGSSQNSRPQNDQASNYAVASKQRSDAEKVGKAKLESEEWTLKAICLYVKGNETFFKPVPTDSAKYPIFDVTTKTFVEKIGCSEPVAGKLYKLTLKFYIRSEKATHVPTAHVINAKTIRNRLRGQRSRSVTTVAESTSSQPPQVPVHDSSAATSKQQRLSTYTGVVCYKDGDVCYVYAAQMGYEIPVDRLCDGFDAGDWVEFNVNDEEDEAIALDPKPVLPRLHTTPIHHSVLIECSIMLPMDVQDTDDTIMSSFVGNVRDTHGLVQRLSPGVHNATIRYVYDDGRDCGLWQLEYVYAKEL